MAKKPIDPKKTKKVYRKPSQYQCRVCLNYYPTRAEAMTCCKDQKGWVGNEKREKIILDPISFKSKIIPISNPPILPDTNYEKEITPSPPAKRGRKPKKINPEEEVDNTPKASDLTNFNKSITTITGIKMSMKEKLFCEHYAKTTNGLLSAHKAGYTQKNLSVLCNELLKKPNIQQYLKEIYYDIQYETDSVRKKILTQLTKIGMKAFTDEDITLGHALKAIELIIKMQGYDNPLARMGGGEDVEGGKDIIIHINRPGNTVSVSRAKKDDTEIVDILAEEEEMKRLINPEANQQNSDLMKDITPEEPDPGKE